MWTRKELKQKGKMALSRNYWKAVLISLLLLIIGGGSASTVLAGGAGGRHGGTVDEAIEQAETGEWIVWSGETKGLKDGKFVTSYETAGEIAAKVGEGVEQEVLKSLEAFEQISPAAMTAYAVVFVIVCIVVMAAVLTMAALADALLLNPLCVGAQRFMLKSVEDTGNVAELGYTFDHNYKNGVKTTFIRDLQIFLWALLLIVPGIYKKYQYYMVDYILAENPDMPYREVLERSKKMMDGQKWNTFVLDLSFILWHMLGTLTCGLTEVFYTRPYQYLTRAALYRALCGQEKRAALEKTEENEHAV